MPDEGTARAQVLAMMSFMSTTENAAWESGPCSGTMYCGDHGHYDFLNEAFAHFSYVNSLQRDMCPSSTKFEAEIIAMTLDMLNASALDRTSPVGLVTSGGSGSIAHAMLAYREFNADKIGRPNVHQTRNGPPRV